MASTYRSWDPSSSTPNCNPRSFEPLGWDRDEIEVLVVPPLDRIYICWNHNLRWVSFPLPFFPRPDVVTTPQNAKCSHHNISLIRWFRSPEVSHLCTFETIFIPNLLSLHFFLVAVVTLQWLWSISNSVSLWIVTVVTKRQCRHMIHTV